MSLLNPRQTVLITSREEHETFGKNNSRDNIIAVDWHTPLSFNPLMYAISVNKDSFSAILIRRSNNFAVNFMPLSLKQEVLFCGRNSGKYIDKFEKSGLKKEECDKIDCPRIGEALGHLECEVIEEREVGDHILFIANVVFSSKNREGKRIYHVFKDDFTTTED